MLVLASIEKISTLYLIITQLVWRSFEVRRHSTGR